MNYLTCENCWVSSNIDNDVKWVWGGLIEWFSVEWTFQYSYVEKIIKCIVARRKNCSKITSAFLKYVYVNYSLAQAQTIIPFSLQTRQDSLTRLERVNVWKLNSFVFHLYSTYTQESRHFLTPKSRRKRQEKCFMASKSSKSDHVWVD